MRVHFLGIGGSGASAAAAIAQAQDFEVTGCDLEPNNEFTTQFKSSQLLKGHNPEHLYRHPERSEGSHDLKSRDSFLIAQNDSLVDILAVTPAIFSLDPNNPELQEAKKKNIPILTWQEFMGRYLIKDKFVIAVCGTHGKTTITAMIAKLLEDANLDPTVELGAIVPWWKTNYRIPSRHSERSEESHDSKSGDLSLIARDDKKDFFIVEADEFNDNFLAFEPDISVVTNIEMDHPEYFKDLEAVKESFKKFLLQTKEVIVANLMDPGVTDVIKAVIKTSLPKNDDRHKMAQFLDYSKNQLNFHLKIPGDFNKLNAQAAIQVGLLLNIDPQIIQQSLSNYPGVGRRFEYIGDYKGAKIYSDFGHHPTEIKTTMQAAREKFPKNRILLVYQPHMFSRTKALFDDFVKVFQEIPVDKTFIMDIYPSREVDSGLVTSKQLVETINKEATLHIGGVNQTLEKLKPEIKSGDILFFMSAGDTDYLAKKLVKG